MAKMRIPSDPQNANVEDRVDFKAFIFSLFRMKGNRENTTIFVHL